MKVSKKDGRDFEKEITPVTHYDGFTGKRCSL